MSDDGGWPVSLTRDEMMWAVGVGCLREANSRLRGSKHDPPLKLEEEGWAIHIEGACGELAVCKLLGDEWRASVDTYKREADIGDGGEVRTRSQDWHELTIRDNDNPNSYYILVTGLAPNFVVRGYIQGHKGQNPKWRKDPNKRGEAWFVPQRVLTPFTQRGIEERRERRATERAAQQANARREDDGVA